MQWLYSIFLSFLLVLFIPSPGQAQTTGTENEVQADFDAALQDLDANRLRAARERLTTLLSTNPSLSRARLELARAWYLSGNYQQARQETEQVLDDPNTPPPCGSPCWRSSPRSRRMKNRTRPPASGYPLFTPA